MEVCCAPISERHHQPLRCLLQAFDMPGKQLDSAVDNPGSGETAITELQTAIAWR